VDDAVVMQEDYLFLYKAMESLCNDEETCAAGDRDSGIANCNNYSVGGTQLPQQPSSPTVEPTSLSLAQPPALDPSTPTTSQPSSPRPSSPVPQTADVTV